MSDRPRGRKLLVSCLLLLVVVGAVYSGWVVYRSARAYSEHKQGRGWIGRVFETDPELGFRLAPGARGIEAYPAGPDIAVCADADGFRVPADAPAASARERPLVLALGCSFTFGMACEAQKTYPLLVAHHLHGTCLNAGCPSYGAAQMLLLARRLVPRERPDYVLFQHSPWLAERSRRRTAPSFLSSLAAPCFEIAPTGIELRPPAYRSRLFDLPVGRYLRSPTGLLDFLSFEAGVGIPLLVHDDIERGLMLLREGTLDPPSSGDITRSVLAEVADLCGRHGARLVIVKVGKSRRPIEIEEAALPAGCLVVEAGTALNERLPDEQPSSYLARYGRWGGDPPVLIDAHPNPLAHSIIAEAIVAAIEGERRAAGR